MAENEEKQSVDWLEGDFLRHRPTTPCIGPSFDITLWTDGVSFMYGREIPVEPYQFETHRLEYSNSRITLKCYTPFSSLLCWLYHLY